MVIFGILTVVLGFLAVARLGFIIHKNNVKNDNSDLSNSVVYAFGVTLCLLVLGVTMIISGADWRSKGFARAALELKQKEIYENLSIVEVKTGPENNKVSAFAFIRDRDGEMRLYELEKAMPPLGYFKVLGDGAYASLTATPASQPAK